MNSNGETSESPISYIARPESIGVSELAIKIFMGLILIGMLVIIYSLLNPSKKGLANLPKLEIKKPAPFEIAQPQPIKLDAPNVIGLNAPKSIGLDVPSSIRLDVPKSIALDANAIKFNVPSSIKVDMPSSIKLEIPKTMGEIIPPIATSPAKLITPRSAPSTIEDNISMGKPSGEYETDIGVCSKYLPTSTNISNECIAEVWNSRCPNPIPSVVKSGLKALNFKDILTKVLEYSRSTKETDPTRYARCYGEKGAVIPATQNGTHKPNPCSGYLPTSTNISNECITEVWNDKCPNPIPSVVKSGLKALNFKDILTKVLEYSKSTKETDPTRYARCYGSSTIPIQEIQIVRTTTPVTPSIVIDKCSEYNENDVGISDECLDKLWGGLGCTQPMPVGTRIGLKSLKLIDAVKKIFEYVSATASSDPTRYKGCYGEGPTLDTSTFGKLVDFRVGNMGISGAPSTRSAIITT